MNSSVRRGGSSVGRVTSRGRIAHLSKLALMFMNAEVKRLCWDCRVEHKVVVEESGQARVSGRGQSAKLMPRQVEQ